MEQLRICAFGVKEHELEELRRQDACPDVSINMIQEPPSFQNADEAKGCVGVTVSGMYFIGQELLDAYKANGVRFLTTRTRGFDHIDVGYARKIGIRVAYASYPPGSVAEFTIMMILMSLRCYKPALWRGQVNDFELAGLMGRDLHSLTVGVLGTGQIGVQVIKYLAGFGARILAYDCRENEEVRLYGEYTDKETIFREADIITLHLPLLSDTYHLIDRDSISQMKDGVVLINCARGELADTEALIEGVENGKIGALALDTVEGEGGIVHEDHRSDILPNKNYFYLRQFKNVIITPHMAFYTSTSVNSMVRCGIEGIRQMAAGNSWREEIL